MHMMAKHPNNAADILVDSFKANQRVRNLCDITLNLIDRQGSGGEEDYDLGYATAMRDVLNALDGEQA